MIILVLVSFLGSSVIANFTHYPQKFFVESLIQNEIRQGVVQKGISFICYTMQSNDSFELELNNENTADRLLLSQPLVFLIHGWKDEGTSFWVQEIQTTWRQFQDVNICAVDWRKFAGQDYKRAMLKIYRVGKTVSQMVQWLESVRGFVRGNMIFVGYSLGAHAAGYAGAQLNGKIGEIIGLDPAGPLFSIPYDVGTKYRLDETDAQFVQVMHTTAGTLGINKKCGHADFYPNGGASPQPNCVPPALANESNKNPIGCSHSTSVKFFKYSINPNYPFAGRHCYNYKHFKWGFCRWSREGRFGIHSKRSKGNFYFTTMAYSPYVKELRGKKNKRTWFGSLR